MKEIRNELMKTTLGRCIWVIVLITVGSWIASAVYSLLVLLMSSIAGIFAMFSKKSQTDAE